MDYSKLTHRYIARFCIEASSPLAIGSGKSGLENERLIAEDANGLPYIPGTSIAGVLRHALKKYYKDETRINTYFGYQVQNSKDGRGSLLSFSPGQLDSLDGSGVLEGILSPDQLQPNLKVFESLPERDHVRISHKGVAVKHGKFAEKLVYTGTRFVFEIELKGEGADEEKAFFEVLQQTIYSQDFRLGAGTRNGFGAFNVIEHHYRDYDLAQAAELKNYLNHSSSLNSKFEGAEPVTLSKIKQNKKVAESWHKYVLKLKPTSYFIFGSGDLIYNPSQQNWLDNFSKKEKRLIWSEGKASLSDRPFFIIPGTSVKGAIAHRVAYHYNLLTGAFIETLAQPQASDMGYEFDMEAALAEFILNVDIDQLNYPSDSDEWKKWMDQVNGWKIEDAKAWENLNDALDTQREHTDNSKLPVGEHNPAIQELFGYAKQKMDKDENQLKGARGKVIIPDLYLDPEYIHEKLITHVAIDRFTGGAKDGALFDEKVIYYDREIQLEIFMEKENEDKSIDPIVIQAFEQALDDICNGHLFIGGNIAKGHGKFEGAYQKSEVV